VPVGAASTSNAPNADIVVTGSRIVRNGFAAPTPVTVATSQRLLQTSPSNLADGLNKLPALFGSYSQTTPLGSNNTRSGNYLNLRDFGYNRSLILMDGHRIVPTSIDGTVDVNTIPQLLVQRVDIVTAGASAVYGSDAVTGVVNFVTDTHFTGYRAVAQGGVSQHGDDGSQRVGVAAGWKIGDRGHLELSAEYYNSEGIPLKEGRPLGDLVVSETGAGTTANPYVQTYNARISTETYGGLIATGPLAGYMFLPNGSLAKFNPGMPTGSKGLASGGDGAYYKHSLLVAGLRTKQVYGRFDYDLTDNLKLYVKGNYTDSLNSQDSLAYPDARAPGTNTGIVIYSGNAFLPTAVQSALTATNTASFQLGRLSEDLGNRPIYTDTKSYGGALGLEGKLFGGWKWDAFYSHQESTLDVDFTTIDNRNFYAAVDAVRDPAGNIVCRVTLTNPGLYPGCTPLNLFGAGAPSEAAVNYVNQKVSTHTVTRQNDVALNFAGDIANLWAGPISAAFGGEYRTLSQFTTASNDMVTPGDFTGLRGGFVSGTTLPYAGSGFGVGGGSNRVWELNGEIVVPVLNNSPLGKHLELNGAVRYTSYRTSGTAVTWKAGVSYEPFDDLRIRAVASRDIRAPTINELFAGKSIGVLGYNDTHTGVSSTTQLIAQGNPDLVPEVAQTYTAGLVYHPHWLPGFSMSVDWFKISIHNAIATVGGNNAIAAATCEQSNGASPLCALFIRPLPFSDRSAANFPTQLISENLNVGTAITSGADFEFDYQLQRDQLVPGQLGFRLLGTYQPIDKQSPYPGAPVLNYSGTAANPGIPKWRLALSTDYTIGDVTFDLTTRWRSRMAPNANRQLVFIGSAIPSQFNLDLNVNYKIPNTKFQTFLTINNLLDAKPAPYGNLSNTASPGGSQAGAPGEDVILRYFTVGVRYNF